MAKKQNTSNERAARAAAALAAQQKAEKRRNLITVVSVVAVLVLVIGGVYVYLTNLDDPADVAAAGAGEGTYGVTIGDDDAPHSLVIYEDFLCPYCGEFESATRTKLEKAANAGNVQIEYRPFNLLSSISDYSERSASAFFVVLDKEGPTVAKKFHDILYENQPSEDSETFPDNQQLLDWAVEAGADEDTVSDGILNESKKAFVAKATTAATDAGVQGTPTVILDGEQVSGSSVDDIAQTVIDTVS
ncbi:thioredoxin domain-containing protein [Nocardioides sp. GY 10127]|uniref:DsbA family protein n=1 Tax=Nocardioides sp. GY 10127 TaxID=2569762 RepID=UPI0010A8F1A5|nr:thioredoxin domain-containing protein [Nocardioides sp. GY 10127]TIC81555.1 disulfide bond formation protein DsbA [Nocardioides sp. GY 10127]